MKKYGYTETRDISSYRMRELCIAQGWFTLATNTEYDRFLRKAAAIENITTDDLVELATDVKEWSDTDMEIENIMWHIAKACYVYFTSESDGHSSRRV